MREWGVAYLLYPHILLATSDHHPCDIRGTLQLHQHLPDLLGQLSRRRDDQDARDGNLGTIQQSLQDGQQEGGGLAGAGDRGCADIPPSESIGDDLSLDRCRRGVAHC